MYPNKNFRTDLHLAGNLCVLWCQTCLKIRAEGPAPWTESGGIFKNFELRAVSRLLGFIPNTTRTFTTITELHQSSQKTQISLVFKVFSTFNALKIDCACVCATWVCVYQQMISGYKPIQSYIPLMSHTLAAYIVHKAHLINLFIHKFMAS